MCELLWSDPHPGTGRAPSKRGVGVAFGSDVTDRFLEDNNLGSYFPGPPVYYIEQHLLLWFLHSVLMQQ